MNIKIGKFEIESDKQQFTLYENRKKGVFPGKPENIPDENEKVREIVGYYSTLESCLVSIPNKVLLRSDAKTLLEAVQEVKHYRKLIKFHLEAA